VSGILRLPNFFIVGAPKAGTTSLYAYPGQHPQVYMCPIKEPGYFAPEHALQSYLSNWEGYLTLYRDGGEETANRGGHGVLPVVTNRRAQYCRSHPARQNHHQPQESSRPRLLAVPGEVNLGTDS
jgi:hypothetical protein